MANVEIDDVNYIPDIIEILEQINNKKLLIGVMGSEGSEILMIAEVQEYGARITVTEALRGYFLSQGFPLKKETSFLNVPARSYLRTTFDEEKDNIEQLIIDLLKNGIMNLEINDANKFWERIGEYVVAKIKRKINKIQTPSLHPFTIQQRTRPTDSPLRDTGEHLIKKIDYKVVDG